MRKPATWGPTMNGFFFILNPLAFDGPLPFELIPRLFLRKPDPEELSLIQGLLNGFATTPGRGTSFHVGYNSEFVPSPASGGKGTKVLKALASQEHRYWVVAGDFKRPIQLSGGSELVNLRCSANLIKNDLDFGFGFFETPAPYGWSVVIPDNATFTYLMHHNMDNPTVTLTSEELTELTKIYCAVAAAEKRNPSVFRLVHQFASIKSLPRRSDMQIIGYFSILEALVTHIPTIHETDSLTHQIGTKLPLLTKLFERKLDYASFEAVEPVKIWKKLYSCRSSVAHGNCQRRSERESKWAV